MINVHTLCSKSPPAATHSGSLFCHSPTALSIMRWSIKLVPLLSNPASLLDDIINASLVNLFLQYAPDLVVIELGSDLGC